MTSQLNELLLYIFLEDHVSIDDATAQTIGVADKAALVALIQDASAQYLITNPQALADGIIRVHLTDEGQTRVNELLEFAHATGQDDELDEATRRSFGQPKINSTTLMVDLAKD